MGRYYNRGRGNLPLSLSKGHAFSVPGNTWFELTGADETQASVLRAVRKGQLFRQPTGSASAVAPTAPVKEEAKTSAVPAEEETTGAATPSLKSQGAALSNIE